MDHLHEVASSNFDVKTLDEEIMVIKDHPTLKNEKALFFAQDFEVGTVIFDISDLPVVSQNDSHAITLSPGRYIYCIGHVVCFTNHACDPTMVFD